MMFILFHVVAPSQIELVGHEVGSLIEVNENEELELTCRVLDAKPAASIRWYKDDSLVTDLPPITEEDGKENGTKTASSTLRLRPTSRDNGASVACEAEHPALPQGRQMRAAVAISVLCE